MKVFRILLAAIGLFAYCHASAAPTASPKPCTNCKHHRDTACTNVTSAPKCEKTSQTLGAQLISGFGIRAGWRWQDERECPTVQTPTPPTTHKDPFFLGLEFRLPLYENVSGFVANDWDWNSPHPHQTTLGLVWCPGKR